ncbi:MAG: ubiquinol-cytochrome c reductase iron-sulfur subunit [Pseudonocardiaceae bacterium]
MSRHAQQHGSEVTRRAVVAGTAVAAGSAALAACGNGEQDAGAPSAPGGERLASTGDIPVGGGTVFASKKVVVTQPTPGMFTAFSAICTHQGCPVNKVASGTIDCPCHGSRFAIADGSVVQGPASRPLPGRQITVSGDALLLE